MRELDDSILVAYVDGELDAETEREVTAAIAEDPLAQKKVQAFRETAALVRRLPPEEFSRAHRAWS